MCFCISEWWRWSNSCCHEEPSIPKSQKTCILHLVGFGLPNKRKGDHCSWQVGQHERILVSVNLIITILLCKAYIFFMNLCVQYSGAMDSMHGAAPNVIIPCSSVFHNIITMCILSLLMTTKSWLGLRSFFLNCLQRSIDKMFCSKFVRLPVALALQSPDPVSNTVVELQSLSM